MSANPVTSLGAAIRALFHTGRQWRGASEFFRSTFVRSTAQPSPRPLSAIASAKPDPSHRPIVPSSHRPVPPPPFPESQRDSII